MIKQEVVDRVREQSDIVEFISAYVPLKRIGRNYRGLCPFHAERSPSFYVSHERQSYHCFGCGAGGNVITFIMAQEKLEFPEAVRFLAGRLGISVEVEQGTGRNQPLYDVCEQVAGYYEEQLRKSEQAQAYLRQRGIRPDTVRRFRLGYAPEGNVVRGAARRRGWSDEALAGAGLIVRRGDGYTDYFRGRIVFPVFSLSGKTVGFSGRTLGADEPKYLNSPDTPIFRKGGGLYGLFQAKGYIRDAAPVLVEGNFDLLSLVNSGMNNVIAPLGTSLTPEQALLIRRFNNRVLLCFDGDEAGQRACHRAIEVLLKAGVDPQIVVLPLGSDPDSLVRSEGAEKFRARLKAAQDFVDFLQSCQRPSTVTDKRRVLAKIVQSLQMIPDEITRELYANKVAEVFGVDKRRLLATAPAEKETRSPSEIASDVEIRLVGVMAQSAELARLASQLRLPEALTDERLKLIARLAESCCERPGYGPAMLIDLTDDGDLKKLVASLPFIQSRLPSRSEFRSHAVRQRAAWLMKQIKAAHEAGDENLAVELGEERSKLLRRTARKGATIDEEQDTEAEEAASRSR